MNNCPGYSSIVTFGSPTWLTRLSLMAAIVAGCSGGAETEENPASPPINPSISIVGGTIDEGDLGTGLLVFDVQLSGASDNTITVGYSTAGVTASSGTDFDAASGELTFSAGLTAQTISVLVHGDAVFELDEQFRVFLSSPTNAILASETATGTIINDDLAPTVSVSSSMGAEGDNGSRLLDFNVSLSALSGVNATVDYSTSDFTATAMDDYAATSGSLSIPAGTTIQTFSVSVSGDSEFEPDEEFIVTLSGAVNAALGNAVATGTIVNDDSVPPNTPVITISGSTITEGSVGSVLLIFDVRLSQISNDIVSVDYATTNQTANFGSDYDAVSSTLNFPVGTSVQSIEVAVHGDVLFESDENLGLLLSNAVNAVLGNNSGLGTIINDDAPPSISIGDTSLTEGDNGTTVMTFSAGLSAVSGLAATVDYATSDNTASASSDYTAATGSITFPVGTVSQSIVIDIIGDTDDEKDENFSVTLASAVNATISDGVASGTIQNDDSPGGQQPGLDSRPTNTTCIAPIRQSGNATVSTIEAFPNLPNLSQPTKILMEPVGNPRWFVLQKSGELRVFDPDNATAAPIYIDLSGTVRTNSEGGLLGMEFHPNYPATPEVFLSYTRNHTGPSARSIISRFILDDVVNPGAGTIEQVIIEIDQDFDNHNGGDIAFGPDGYLYVGLGDGGSGGDPNDRAQNPRHMLGSFLRIDVLDPGVSHPANTYIIPPDNPFAGNAKCGPGLNADNCPEIYAWGLRNPWRWSFDLNTGSLWAADVGQGNVEEVDLIERGGNYGWRCYEGSVDLFVAGCVNNGFVNPVSEYPHTDGNISITGGFVYRGSALPALIGRYVFADFGSGRIWALLSDGQGGYTNDELIDTSYAVTSFGMDQFGELYFTDINTGRILKIIPGGGGSSDNIATLLSDSGCVDPNNVTQPYSGLIPYDINAPFWSDAAQKERWIGVPDGTTIAIDGNDDWVFPAGTVIVKNFRLNGTLIETRHLMHHPDGVWAGYTYEWNLTQTEATRVVGGKTVLIDGQSWLYPSEGQCMNCHTSAAGFSLGPETAQLNRDITYPSTQRTASQLETLDHILMLSSPLPAPVQDLPVLADPADPNAPVSDRARAYLHSNCAQCHRPGGPTPSGMDFRYTTPLASTNACDAIPQAGDLGIANARIIAAGESARSTLIRRVGLRNSSGMPPLGSNIVDSSGISLLSSWIDGLANCN